MGILPLGIPTWGSETNSIWSQSNTVGELADGQADWLRVSLLVFLGLDPLDVRVT